MKHNKILIVDKEASYRKMLCKNLEERAYKTAHAGSIREAQELAGGFYPDLVVMDVMLSDGDGYDLYTELRAKRPNLPVLFLCADDLEIARLRGLGFDPSGWLIRSTADTELFPRAEKVLQRVYEHISED